jgi:hypothetical protein
MELKWQGKKDKVSEPKLRQILIVFQIFLEEKLSPELAIRFVEGSTQT